MKKLAFLVSAMVMCVAAQANYSVYKPVPYTDANGNSKVGCDRATWVEYYHNYATNYLSIPPLADGEVYNYSGMTAYCNNGYVSVSSTADGYLS